MKYEVDIDGGNRLVENLKTFLPCIGGFNSINELPKVEDPVLVMSTDGVGSKVLVPDIYDTIGIDLVAMSVNDVIVSGAKPLFFLDYLATNNLDNAERIVKGIHHGCKLAGCTLVGGETAEMPDNYPEDEFDLAGFCIGIQNKYSVVDPKFIKPGDVIIGLPSTGLHSNGYSLARKLDIPLEMLQMPTKIYSRYIERISQKVNIKGMAHITGGGIIDNIARLGIGANILRGGWPRPEVYDIIESQIETDEMYRVFNCGIGFAIVIDKKDVGKVDGYYIGEVTDGETVRWVK